MILKIAEPCHENWENMMEAEKVHEKDTLKKEDETFIKGKIAIDIKK